MVFSPPITTATPARILIVEDEGIIASHIASRLSRAGYSVAGIAESSEEALDSIRDLFPDLILMDVRIKGSMDGIATASKLQEDFDIPVVYLTAHTDQQTIDRAKVTGPFGFLTKPIHDMNLSITIEMAIYKHRADREARRQRAWMATILGAMADAMVVIDHERKVQYLNRPAGELTGWTNEAAHGRSVDTVIPLAESASGVPADKLLFALLDSRQARQLPRGLISSTQAGKWFPIEGEIAPSVDNGEVVGAVITFRNATSRQSQEVEERHQHKMQAVGRLSAGIAHDFNNLLFIILGYTEEMLGVNGRSDLDRRALTEIKKAAENATNITQQLLKFSRRERIERQDVNLNDLIRDTEELFRRIGGPSVKWQFKLGQNLGVVRADPGQLKQVLMNLATNARDAMSDGGKVTIETSNVDAPRAGSGARGRDAFVALSMTDTGSGMNAETAERLFDPFFTTKEPGRGTGLGLSIVHSIMTDLGGTIHVDSTPGDGATFTVYIPRTALAGLPDVEEPITPEAPQPPTILLVEDQDGVRLLLYRYLVNAGYKVLEARDGEAAIRIANEHESAIDLIVTDMVMPKANGIEVAKAVEEKRPGTQMVFISGYAEELMNGIETLPPGARFLPKPFSEREFLNAVDHLLKRGKNWTMKSSN